MSNLVLYSIFNENTGTKIVNYAEDFRSQNGDLIGNAKYVQDDVPFDNILTLIKYLITDRNKDILEQLDKEEKINDQIIF